MTRQPLSNMNAQTMTGRILRDCRADSDEYVKLIKDSVAEEISLAKGRADERLCWVLLAIMKGISQQYSVLMVYHLMRERKFLPDQISDEEFNRYEIDRKCLRLLWEHENIIVRGGPEAVALGVQALKLTQYGTGIYGFCSRKVPTNASEEEVWSAWLDNL